MKLYWYWKTDLNSIGTQVVIQITRRNKIGWHNHCYFMNNWTYIEFQKTKYVIWENEKKEKKVDVSQ